MGGSGGDGGDSCDRGAAYQEEGALWGLTRIHAGSVRSDAAVREEVEVHFRALRAADLLRLWFAVGHSLDGALAFYAVHLQVVYEAGVAVEGEVGADVREATAREIEAALTAWAAGVDGDEWR